jgi:hypothetical protein
MELDFEIDKITESIESAETGESFETRVVPVSAADLKLAATRNGWQFDWGLESSYPERQVYKLIIEKEPNVIQGLVSFEKKEKHVFMHLIESSPFNIGRDKKYLGAPCNLVAYGSMLSKWFGFNGVLSFRSKTALIFHYEKTLGAEHIGGGLMAIFEKRAEELINQYFPEKENKL